MMKQAPTEIYLLILKQANYNEYLNDTHIKGIEVQDLGEEEI